MEIKVSDDKNICQLLIDSYPPYRVTININIYELANQLNND